MYYKIKKNSVDLFDLFRKNQKILNEEKEVESQRNKLFMHVFDLYLDLAIVKNKEINIEALDVNSFEFLDKLNKLEPFSDFKIKKEYARYVNKTGQPELNRLLEEIFRKPLDIKFLSYEIGDEIFVKVDCPKTLEKRVTKSIFLESYIDNIKISEDEFNLKIKDHLDFNYNIRSRYNDAFDHSNITFEEVKDCLNFENHIISMIIASNLEENEDVYLKKEMILNNELQINAIKKEAKKYKDLFLIKYSDKTLYDFLYKHLV